MEHDYYSTLGVSRFASEKALKRAYRSRIRQVHPDLHHADRFATDRARKVIEAYEALCDPESRRRYDRTLCGPTARITVPVYAYDGPCPLWLTRLFALLLFFAVAAGMFCVITGSLTERELVFRPSLDTIGALSDQHVRRDRAAVLHIDCRQEAQNPNPGALF